MTYLGNNRWIHIGGNSMVVDGRRKTTNWRSKSPKVESTCTVYCAVERRLL